MKSVVWINGEWRGPEQCIGANDRGYLLGEGAFETMLCRDGAPVFFDAHIARLMHGLEVLNIPSPDVEALRSVIPALASKNNLQNTDAILRLTVTRGGAGRGLAPAADKSGAPLYPSCLMTIDPAPPPPASPVSLHISGETVFAGAPEREFKAIAGYGPHLRARYEAAAAGAEDAVMLNERGHVVSASAATLFALTGLRQLITPPLEDGALPGVTRGKLLALASRAGLSAIERTLFPADLERFDLFLANSILRIQPARLSGCACTRRKGTQNAAIGRLAALLSAEIENDMKKSRS